MPAKLQPKIFELELAVQRIHQNLREGVYEFSEEPSIIIMFLKEEELKLEAAEKDLVSLTHSNGNINISI